MVMAIDPGENFSTKLQRGIQPTEVQATTKLWRCWLRLLDWEAAIDKGS